MSDENMNNTSPGSDISREDKINAIKRAVQEQEKLEDAERQSRQAPKKLAPLRQEPPVSGQAPVQRKKKKKKKKKKKTLGQRIRGLFPERGDSILERLRKLLFLGSLAAIVVCGYLVGDYYYALFKNSCENTIINNIYWQNQEDDIRTPSVTSQPGEREFLTMLAGAVTLKDINPEVVGYMTIPSVDGSNPIVQLPVVQATDNSKYLNTSFYGDESIAGTLFLDWRNAYDKVVDNFRYVDNSDNIIVYGHNMANDSMFGCLKYYQRNADYYSNHPIIEFSSNYKNYTYKIFSFFIVDAADDTDTKYDCWNTLDFNGSTEFYRFVNEAKRRSLRLNDVDVQYGDKLLTLSTCNTILDKRGRLIVMARLVRDGEDPYEGTQNSWANPNIKWPSLYYEYNSGAQRYDPNAEFEPYGDGNEENAG